MYSLYCLPNVVAFDNVDPVILINKLRETGYSDSVLSDKKRKLVHFNREKINPSNISITVDGYDIKLVDCARFLGITFDYEDQGCCSKVSEGPQDSEVCLRNVVESSF